MYYSRSFSCSKQPAKKLETHKQKHIQIECRGQVTVAVLIDNVIRATMDMENARAAEEAEAVKRKEQVHQHKLQLYNIRQDIDTKNWM